MPVTDEELARRLEQFRAVCRERGVKLTPQRLAIFREAAASDEHPDAETLFQRVRERVPTISQDTVYRTLWLFADLGLVTALGYSRERLRFDSNPTAHHHFVCSRCGKVGDFECDTFDQLTAPDAVQAWGVVAKVQVEFRGLCHNCAALAPERQASPGPGAPTGIRREGEPR